MNLSEKKFEKIYEVTIFHDEIAALIMRKCIVSVASDKVKVQKIVICLEVVVHIVQDIKF